MPKSTLLISDVRYGARWWSVYVCLIFANPELVLPLCVKEAEAQRRELIARVTQLFSGRGRTRINISWLHAQVYFLSIMMHASS